MRAAVYRGANDLRVETVPVPRIASHELLVKVAVCGVCPTDIKKIQYGTVPPPRIFGHETAGTIVRIGGGASVLASRFKIGDRVALHHHVPCLDCHFCRHRAFAQCVQYKRTGITAGFEPAGGGFAEYVRVMPFVLPGVVKIPAQNSFEEAAMLEPVNTVLKAVKRLTLLRGDVILVAGQGPIGLMFTRLLQLRGMKVLATDLMPSRLQLAKKFGARWILLGRDGSASRPVQIQPASLITRHLPLDAAVIAVPSDAAVRQAFQLVRGGGQILLFAHTKRASSVGRVSPLRAAHSSELLVAAKRSEDGRPGEGNSKSKLQMSGFTLDLASVCVDEKDLIGSYSSDFTLQPEVARLVFSRKLDIRPLISHRFPLERTAKAIALAARPVPDSLKIVIQQSGQ